MKQFRAVVLRLVERKIGIAKNFVGCACHARVTTAIPMLPSDPDRVAVYSHRVRQWPGPIARRVLRRRPAARTDPAPRSAQTRHRRSGPPYRRPGPAPSNSTSDLLEKRIAALVAESVVDGLEPVEIQQEHGEGVSCREYCPARRQGPLEQVTICKAGQAIIVGQPLDPVLGSLAFGDVFMRRNPATALAPSIGNIDDAPVRKLHRCSRCVPMWRAGLRSQPDRRRDHAGS